MIYDVIEKRTANNNSWQAQRIQDNDDVEGRVDSILDIDWYKIQFDYDGRANFYLKPLSSRLNVDLYVYSSNMTTLLDLSKRSAGQYELIELNNIEKDRDYYIKVIHKGSSVPSNNKYHLRCKVYPYFDKTLSVTKYQQQDSRWANKELDCINPKTKKPYTIGEVGCYLTSGAMVLGETPLTHYNRLDSLGVTNCDYPCETVAGKYNKTYENKGSRDNTDRFNSLKDDIFKYIYNKKVPVIARLKGTSGTHFIVIKGFTGEVESDKNGLIFDNITKSMFKVNDPGYTNNKTLEDALSSGYTKLTHIEVMY